MRVVTICLSLFLIGCASTPAEVQRREQAEREIEVILSQPSDAGEYVETKRCLRETEYRDFRALDDRHILFEGRRGRMWINRLPIRCPDLRHATIITVRSTLSLGRMCRHDSFQAGDWFNWPWYRRYPWRWTSPWHSGVSCSLGDFQAVTPAQVDALERAIKSKYK